VNLGNCGPGRLISDATADRLDVLCPRTNRVRLIRVDAGKESDRRWEEGEDLTLLEFKAI
jgi:hypothetical protein